MTKNVEAGQTRRWNDNEYAENAGQQFRVERVRGVLADYVYLTGRKKDQRTWAGVNYIEENSEVTPKKSTWSVVEKVTFDPANVKAGDTATAEVSPVHTDGDGPKPFTITGEVWADGQTLMLGGWSITLPNLTLTDHQPAPEPEPEHAPGFYTVHPYDSPETNWTGFVDSEGTFYGEEDGFFRQAFKGDYTVNSRLVVIDPADVDVEALSDVYDKAYDDSSHTSFSEDADIKAGLRAVLEHLGVTK